MKEIFLGKWWHWLILVVVAGLFWMTGLMRMHVIHFNTFVALLLVGTLIIVLAVVLGTKPGEQVTRDKLE